MIVLDSDVIIDYLRGEPGVVEEIQACVQAREPLATTVVNVAEILRGLQAAGATQRQARFEDLLETLDVLDVDLSAARRYGQVLSALDAAGRPIPGMDGFIAAVTLEAGAQLFTGNQRHFDLVAGLHVLDREPG